MKDKNGMEHDEKNGRFTSGGSTPAEEKRAGEIIKNKMSPADKIASVHIEKDKDNILPELNEDDLSKVGLEKNKPVLVKANITKRNLIEHPDISDEETCRIIGEALYTPADIFKGHETKPYHTFVKPMRLSPKGTGTIDYGLVLLDVSETKENFEVVHWHWIRESELRKKKEK